jgi:hypothetical protein
MLHEIRQRQGWTAHGHHDSTARSGSALGVVPMSTDLLGDPVVDPPAMNAPLPWRVWYLNEYEFWVARNLNELRAAYIENHGERSVGRLLRRRGLRAQ